MGTRANGIGGASGPLDGLIYKTLAFQTGFRQGFFAGATSTLDFIKSLGTAAGWQSLGQGFMDLAALGSSVPTAEGIMLRAQFGQSIDDYVTNIPNMSAYEIGHDIGFGTEKATEALLLSKGVGFGVNVARVGVGQTAFESSLIGGRSALFGRARLGSFGGNANGILNRGYFRVGWSFNQGTHYFQPRIGPMRGATHYRPWIKYTPKN